MDKIYVHGRIPLCGHITVQGSKNAALPILAATLLTEETCILQNCPRISDAEQMQMILQRLGCMVRWEQDGLKVADRPGMESARLLFEEVSRMRCSVYFLGALIGTCKMVELPSGRLCYRGQAYRYSYQSTGTAECGN